MISRYFIFRSKFNDISSKTKKEVGDCIERAMSAIMQYDCNDIADHFKDLWKEVKNGKKTDYLEFYKDLCQVLEEIKAIDEKNEEGTYVFIKLNL
jgi:hypothetical protein